jgi:hypothetical protein
MMSEENKEVKETYTAAEVEELTKGLKDNNRKLIEEKQASNLSAKEATDLANKSKLEAEEANTAQQKKNSEFESLWEQEQVKSKELAEKYSNYENTIKQKDVNASALNIAASLTTNEQQRAMLVEQISKNAVHGENGVTFEFGGIELAGDKLKEKLRTDYPFLVDGNPATSDDRKGGLGNSGGAADKVSKENRWYKS